VGRFFAQEALSSGQERCGMDRRTEPAKRFPPHWPAAEAAASIASCQRLNAGAIGGMMAAISGKSKKRGDDKSFGFKGLADVAHKAPEIQSEPRLSL
jgi:hypothetical protein